MSTAGTVGEPDAGFTPLSLEEAQALMTAALTDVDRDALLAERAEAEAQLRAAEATLGAPAGGGNGRGDPEDDVAGQEREEPVQKPHDVQVQSGSGVQLDVEALQAAAARARQADDEVAQAASEAAERPPAIETQLGTAESAFGRMLEIREELPATWRRLVGALISATGMAIVVGALGWSVYWLLVPIVLILIMTVDLRLAGKSLREASAQASLELASVGGVAPDDLDRIRGHRTRIEEAEVRLAAARAERRAAYARFAELAPGRLPSEVDEIVAEHEADLAARAAADAEPAAPAETAETAEREQPAAEPEQASEAAPIEQAAETGAEIVRPEAAEGAEPAEDQPAPEPVAEQDATAPMPALSEAALASPAPSPAPPAPPAPEPGQGAEPEPTTVTATEWWFGTKDAPEAPPAAAAPVRALAERLSAEGRDALARIQAQLDALDRVELAKKSLEWHEANGSFETAGAGAGEPAADMPPEKS